MFLTNFQGFPANSKWPYQSVIERRHHRALCTVYVIDWWTENRRGGDSWYYRIYIRSHVWCQTGWQKILFWVLDRFTKFRKLYTIWLWLHFSHCTHSDLILQLRADLWMKSKFIWNPPQKVFLLLLFVIIFSILSPCWPVEGGTKVSKHPVKQKTPKKSKNSHK